MRDKLARPKLLRMHFAVGDAAARLVKADEEAERVAFVQSLLDAEKDRRANGAAPASATVSDEPATASGDTETGAHNRRQADLMAPGRMTAKESAEAQRMRQALLAFRSSEAGRRWQVSVQVQGTHSNPSLLGRINHWRLSAA